MLKNRRKTFLASNVESNKKNKMIATLYFILFLLILILNKFLHSIKIYLSLLIFDIIPQIPNSINFLYISINYEQQVQNNKFDKYLDKFYNNNHFINEYIYTYKTNQ
jgi:hypothetical protein